MRRSEEFGVTVSGINVHFDAVQKRKDKIVRGLAKGVEFLMKKNQITVFKGTGRFAGQGKVTVTSAEGKTQNVETKHVLIATGSAPRTSTGRSWSCRSCCAG